MITEAEQVELGANWFCSMGYRAYKEVPVFSSSLDLLLVDQTNTYHGVEFKLLNWKRVIQQAVKHRIVLDYVSIFLNTPKQNQTIERIVQECKANGLGLYFLETDGSITQSLKPTKNKIWQVEKERIAQYLKGKR